ncbi:MAG: hypothetical protein ACJ75J_14905, partial [Cytophagaceae bacterium]
MKSDFLLKIFLSFCFTVSLQPTAAQTLYTKKLISVKSWRIQLEELKPHMFNVEIRYERIPNSDIDPYDVFWYIRFKNSAGEEITVFREGVCKPCPLIDRFYSSHYFIPFWSIRTSPGSMQMVTVELVPFHREGLFTFNPVKLGEYKLSYPALEMIRVRVDELTVGAGIQVDDGKLMVNNRTYTKKGHEAPDPYWMAGNDGSYFHSARTQDSYQAKKDTGFLITASRDALLFKVMDEDVFWDDKIYKTNIPYPRINTQPVNVSITNDTIQASLNIMNLGNVPEYLVEDIRMEKVKNNKGVKGRDIVFTLRVPAHVDTVKMFARSRIASDPEVTRLGEHRLSVKYFMADYKFEKDEEIRFSFEPSIPAISIEIPETKFGTEKLLFTDWKVSPARNSLGGKYGFNVAVKYSGLLDPGGERIRNCITSYSYYYRDSLLPSYFWYNELRESEVTLDNFFVYGRSDYSDQGFIPSLSLPAEREQIEFRVKGVSTCTWKKETFTAGT